jgi:hypothetical protein
MTDVNYQFLTGNFSILNIKTIILAVMSFLVLEECQLSKFRFISLFFNEFNSPMYYVAEKN